MAGLGAFISSDIPLCPFRIVFEITGRRDGEAGCNYAFSEILAVDFHRSDRPPVTLLPG